MLNQQSVQLTLQEWVELYRSTEDVLQKWVVSVGYLKEFSLGPVQFSAEFMSTFPKSTVGPQYFTFTEVKPNTRNKVAKMAFTCWMERVRVDKLTRGNFAICSVKNLINCSLTLPAAGDQRLPFYCLFYQEGEKMDY